MTMTRKDFISIATAIDESTIDGLMLHKKMFIKNMCIILKANNERFNVSRFVNACNISQ